MDPLSQGVVGATLPQALIKKNPYMKFGFLFAFLGGMAADMDIFIRSSSDSLLALEFHRQFTHSLIFIPMGALICSLGFHFLFKNKMPFKLNYLYTFLGYATHGLLDACTTYGTQLFWPFSNARVAWNNVSIIDPLFTIPLLILILISFLKSKPFFAQIALIYGLSYLTLGVVQRERAIRVGRQIAEQRNHQYINGDAKPSFGNIFLWKVIYEANGRFYADAVRLLLSEKIFEGESLEKLDIKRDFPWVKESSQIFKDINRFKWFSMGYVAKHPSEDQFIYDVRYSFLPNKMTGLWGIRLFKEDQDRHARFESTRDLNDTTKHQFFRMLFY